MVLMLDYVREMTISSYIKYGSFEHLLFLFCFILGLIFFFVGDFFVMLLTKLCRLLFIGIMCKF